ncbi:MAG: hypothetical protein ACLR0O_16020, partial [Staphylococcus aureus]
NDAIGLLTNSVKKLIASPEPVYVKIALTNKATTKIIMATKVGLNESVTIVGTESGNLIRKNSFFIK